NQTDKNAGPQDTNGNAGTQDNVDAGKEVSDQHYIMLPLWYSISSTYKSSDDKSTDQKPKDHTGSKTIEEPVNKDDQAYIDKLDRLMSQVKEASDAVDALRKRMEPKKVSQALDDERWVKAMNKKDERGIVVRNKSRLVAQGHRQEEGIDYDEVFALAARIETIRIFFAFASFMGFIVYKMDVKSAFLYDTIEYEDKYVAEILKKFDFSSIKTASTLIKTQKPLVKDKTSCLQFVFVLGSRDSPFDFEAYSDSDYAGADLEKKSTIGGCLFLGRRLISWQCKKQTIVATSTTEAEYVAAAHYYR
nr:ribonuclease H-like domain, reverse transcriptase, RNA-dependent DNA polymerase [Tanacetum cinerariifolium]